MTRRIRRLVLCAGVCVVGAVGGVYAVQSTSQPDLSHAALDQVRIDVVDKQVALAEAARQVEQRFGRVVTYESVMYVAPSDYVGVVPGRDSIRVAYTSHYTTLDAQAGEALGQLLAVWNAGNHSGKFRLERVAGGYHIIPVARRGLDETTEPYSSPLDTRITVPTAERDGEETMALLVRVITDASGRSVHLGSVPFDLRTRITVGAEQQPAREVLWAALQAIDPALSWRLDCGAVRDYATCALNLHVVGH